MPLKLVSGEVLASGGVVCQSTSPEVRPNPASVCLYSPAMRCGLFYKGNNWKRLPQGCRSDAGRIPPGDPFQDPLPTLAMKNPTVSICWG